MPFLCIIRWTVFFWNGRSNKKHFALQARELKLLGIHDIQKEIEGTVKSTKSEAENGTAVSTKQDNSNRVSNGSSLGEK